MFTSTIIIQKHPNNRKIMALRNQTDIEVYWKLRTSQNTRKPNEIVLVTIYCLAVLSHR